MILFTLLLPKSKIETNFPTDRLIQFSLLCFLLSSLLPPLTSLLLPETAIFSAGSGLPPFPSAKMGDNGNPKLSFLKALQTKSPPLRPSLPENPKLIPKSEHLGEPACLYSEEEISTLSAHYSNALVGKFTRGRLSMEQLETSFRTAGFQGKYQLGSLDYKHVLLRFDSTDDYQRCWIKGSWIFNGVHMKILKWSSDFSTHKESSLVPVWCTIREVPLYYYNASSIESIGNSLGTFIKKDLATEMLTRPSAIKLCVEVDLLKPLHSFIRLGSTNKNWKYNVEYEDIPLYCSHCSKLGHSLEKCRALENAEGILKRNAPGKNLGKLPVRNVIYQVVAKETNAEIITPQLANPSNSVRGDDELLSPESREKIESPKPKASSPDKGGGDFVSPAIVSPEFSDKNEAPKPMGPHLISSPSSSHPRDEETIPAGNDLDVLIENLDLYRKPTIYAKDDVLIGSSNLYFSPINPTHSDQGRKQNRFAVLQELEDINLLETGPSQDIAELFDSGNDICPSLLPEAPPTGKNSGQGK